jgi:hypothetical protein
MLDAYAEEPDFRLFDSRRQHSDAKTVPSFAKGVILMFEKELSILKERLQKLTSKEGSGFKYLLPTEGSQAAEMVIFRGCAAELHKNRVSFGRPVRMDLNVGDEPAVLTWTLIPRNGSGSPLWHIEERGRRTTYSTMDLAQEILNRLMAHCLE